MDQFVFEKFASFVKDKYKLIFINRNEYQLSIAVESRCLLLGIGNPLLYLNKIMSDKMEEAVFINNITTGETSFFRYPELFGFLSVKLRQQLSAPNSSLKILHIGCSTGEECYTTAIILDQIGAFSKNSILINAIDINPMVIERAKLGIYSKNALRNTDPQIQDIYFRVKNKNLSELSVKIRERVNYYCLDVFQLLSTSLFMKYDVVFCMNVMIYFDSQIITRLIGILKQLMDSKTCLLTAPTDTIMQMNDNFKLNKEKNVHWYTEPKSSALIPESKPESLFAFDLSALSVLREEKKKNNIKIPLSAEPKNFYALGKESYTHKDFNTAISYFQEGIKKMQNMSDCYAGIARIYADQGNNIQAAQAADQALNLNSENAEALLLLGLLNLQTGNPESAKAYFLKTLKVKPDCDEAKKFLELYLS